MLCGNLDGRGVWRRIHVYIWLNIFTVYLKLSQHCLLISHEKKKVLVTQLCLSLWESMYSSLPGSSVHGILQAKIGYAAAAAAKLLQSCLTLCNPIDGSPPGSPVPGILQARTLEWVPISFCNAWKWKVKVKSFSRVQLLATPWTAAYQAPLPMGFSRQEYWSGVPLPSPVCMYASI